MKHDRLAFAPGETLFSQGMTDFGYQTKRSRATIQARIALISVLALFAWRPGSFAQQRAEREITPIKGDLYRFRNAGHYSVFLVTPAGIIATDPIDAEAARWLKAEIAKRFQKPVKYLIYSHDHADHISGGEVFTDTAIVIAHDNAKAAIKNERRPTAVPDLTFSDRLTVELGGKRVELVYLGKNHSDNSIVLLFPDERVMFAVDFIPVKSLPFRNFPDSYIDEWIDSLKKAEALDFDILAPGHGELGKKDDVQAMRVYLEELRDQVLQYLRTGKSVGEIKQLVTMDKYASWGNYKNYLPLNIEGMVRHLQAHRIPN
ncbi:MAG TPA: MBL fold metallo-hydrolase [Acidobacteriota bacterium]|nr:MBL fold metallo-hydrolase [Acidobacteriota bacterium]